jgi:signal peptidase II
VKKKFILFIAFFLFLFDQLIKFIVVTNMKLFESIKVINNFFYITYVENKGAAFSILTGQKWFLILSSIIVLIILYFNFIKGQKLNKYEIITYGTLLGGIIGNLYDRITRGIVVDYLDFIIFNYDAPIFNFADICIVVSMFVLVLLQLRGEKDEIQNRREQ